MNRSSACDVAIVGGGPAGATAAYLLARQGMHVRLFDKRTYPRPKVCAGLLTWKTIDFIDRTWAVSPRELMREAIVIHACRDYRIYFEGTEIGRGHLDFPFYFVDRAKYDHYWLKKAEKAGARVETGLAVKRVDPFEGTFTLVDDRVVRANTVIGADGVGSKVRLAMPLHEKEKKSWRRNLAATIEAYQPNIGKSPSSFASLHFGQVAWGYGWSFPGPESRTIGLACLPHRTRGNLCGIFDNWIATLAIDPKHISTPKSWPLPYGNFLYTPGCGKALLVGDACGLADPLLGEGIFYAHRSAQIAAEAIAEADRGGNQAAYIYNRTLRKKLLRELFWFKRLRDILFFGGYNRRYRGLKLLLRLFPKRLEMAVHGQKPLSRLLLPWR